MRKISLAATSSLFAFATILAGSPALAQPAQPTDQAPPTAASDEGEIIVIARKRQESLLNVPVIETVIQPEQMERLQVVDLKDITKLAPGLLIGGNVLSIGQMVSIRGVGTSSSDPGIDQSVSLNIDGLSLGQGLAFSSGMFDVQQVEVLKGPQALFYGKSSPGGVIAIRTADPGDEFELIGRVGYEFEARTSRGELILSGPLTDTLGARLAGMVSWGDGYYFNKAITVAPGTGALPTRHSREGPSFNYQIRGTLLWEPSGQFDARLKLNMVHDRVLNGENFQMTSCPEGTAPVTLFPGFTLPPFIGGGEDCVKDRTARVVYYDPAAFPGVLNDGVPIVKTTQRYGTLELNYRPTEDLTLTSVTAYYGLRSHSLLNTSFTSFAGPLIEARNPRFRRKEITQELRLNSDFSGPLNFSLGAFYQDAKVSDRVVILGNLALPFGFPPIPLQDGLNKFTIKTWSVFGQARWEIMPELELAAGARWTDETRKQSPILFPSASAFTITAPVAITVPTPRLHSSNISPEFTITYKPSDDLTLFAAYKRASKSGSFSIATPASLRSLPACLTGAFPCVFLDNSFGDEKVRGFEGGVKGRLLDRQLTFSLAGYNYKYLGLQVGAIEPVVSAIPIIRTLNAGSGRAYGVELEASLRPSAIEGLALNASVNWSHARFKELNNVPCFGGQTVALGCNQQFTPGNQALPAAPGSVVVNGQWGFFFAQDLSGTRFIRAPDWQATFGFNYELPVGNDMKLIFTNSNYYSSKYITGLGLRDDFFQKSFLKVDLGLTLADKDDEWEVAVIGKNVTRKHTTSNCNNANFQGGLAGGQVTGGTISGPAGIDEIGCYMDPGRQIWVRLTVKPSSRK